MSQNHRNRFNTIYDASAEELINQVATRTTSAILHAWRENREAQIVLTGGRTGLAIVKALDVALFRATSEIKSGSSIESKLRVWFSDERFVAYEDVDRSDTSLIAGFERCQSRIYFGRLGTPGESTLSESAQEYSRALDERIGTARFDAVILSMGEDGHIASLFPGHKEQLNSTLSAIAVDNSPKPPALRVSIGVARLAKASAIYIFAVGESKREALESLLGQTKDDHTIGSEQSPISLLRECSPAAQIYLATDLKI